MLVPNHQFFEPAPSIRVTFLRYNVEQTYIQRPDNTHFRLCKFKMLDTLRSISVPTGDSQAICESAKTLECQTMISMEIPEIIHTDIMEKIHSEIRQNITGRNSVWIRVKIGFVRWLVYDFDDFRRSVELQSEREWIQNELAIIENILRDGAGVGGGQEIRINPANKSFIEALETVVFDDGVNGATTCTVCMEDIKGGVEAVRLQCHHLFHHNCIVKWLQFSHSCPLCRHEMPPATDDNDDDQ